MDVIDFTQTVSSTSIGFMMLGVIISVFAPIVLYRTVAGRFKGQILSMVLGVLGYVTIEMLIVNTLVVLPFYIPGVLDFLNARPTLFLAYQLVLNGVLMETGRWFFVYTIYQRTPQIGDAARMAVGYGGTESILMVAMGMFLNITVAMAINDQGLAVLLEGMDNQQITELMTTIKPLVDTPAAYHLITGLDGLVRILFHIAQTLILYLMVSKKGPGWLLPLAMLLRVIYLLPIGLYNQGIYSDLLLNKTLILMVVSLTCGVCYLLYQRFAPDDLKPQEQKPRIKTMVPGGKR